MTIDPPETIIVDDDADQVCCDGGGGALGHPAVWYAFNHGDFVECGYCDRAFVKKRAQGASRGGARKSA